MNISPTENNRLKLISTLALGKNFFSEFCKDPFLLTSNIEIASYTYCAVHPWRNYKLERRVTGKHLNLIFHWFSDNGIGDNYKCHVLLSADENVFVNKRTG